MTSSLEPALTYIESQNVPSPFFMVVENSNYEKVKKNFTLKKGFKVIKISDLCRGPDIIPDWDLLRNTIINQNSDSQKMVVLGISEYLLFQGKQFAKTKLKELGGLQIGKNRVVLILRCIGDWVEELRADPRFDSLRYSLPVKKEKPSDIFTVDHFQLKENIEINGVLSGLKAFLENAEQGKQRLQVQTSHNFNNACFSVTKFKTCYDVIKKRIINFAVPEGYAKNEYWSELTKELDANKYNINKVFQNHGIDSQNSVGLSKERLVPSYENWLFFIRMKFYSNEAKEPYFEHVISKTESLEDLTHNILFSINDFSHTDSDYRTMYNGRKQYLGYIESSYIVNFVQRNRENRDETLYRLTNASESERKEIISHISEYGFNSLTSLNHLDFIYPYFAYYLKRYTFNCNQYASELTSYFEQYKKQKILNHIDDDFAILVDKFAKDRIYNSLPGRNGLVHSIRMENKKSFLYWLDALGVEYLSLITMVCKELDLNLKINIGRADIPTITESNQKFYYDWSDQDKYSDKSLDEIKHKEKGGFDFTKNNKPLHLENEINIITKALDRIKTKLINGYDQVVLTSDHGASRLAVIKNQEEMYETDTKGKHSGRCCKDSSEMDLKHLPYATREDGWIVLADYGRFKGSRRANVEVHGGASLEEVLVPVITLTLKKEKKDKDERIKLSQTEITAGLNETPVLPLFSSIEYDNVCIEITSGPCGIGQRFAAETQNDKQHHNVELAGLKRKGNFEADVYSGDNFLSTVQFNIASGGMKSNNDFLDF